jgi:alkaline phosphatase
MKHLILSLRTAVAILFLIPLCATASYGAKYVFLFIGDGMSATQLYAAECYRRALAGVDTDSAANRADGALSLNVDAFPVRGMQLTGAFNHLITDSAAAGTALACGAKTHSGTLGMDPTGTQRWKSLAVLAKETGRRVGIVTSVSLDHATPAAFYANVSSRGSYEEIAVQALESGFDFFGGGSWLKTQSEAYRSLYPKIGSDKVADIAADEGYTTVASGEGIRALAAHPADKVICSAPVLAGGSALPFSVDRPQDQPDLAAFTDAAIACLTKDDRGFFLMVEGGKIDWACHANDAAGALGDVLAFDKAVGRAVAFYNAHPEETLIVVTGDHETGGLSIGFAGRGYDTSFARLAAQKVSYEVFTQTVDAYRRAKAFPTPYDAAANNIDTAMKELIRKNYGIDVDTLPQYRRDLLETAYDRSMSGTPATGTEVPTGYLKGDHSSTLDYLTYGGYDALTLELDHQLAREAGLSWTSFAHTAVPLPVMALGKGAELFGGYYENAEVARKIAQAMGLAQTLPVAKGE